VKRKERATSVSKKGWSLSTHFFNTAIAVLWVGTAAFWLTSPDQGAMLEIILSLFRGR
jgi:hypothetical protein